jgi:hypothetical protein
MDQIQQGEESAVQLSPSRIAQNDAGKLAAGFCLGAASGLALAATAWAIFYLAGFGPTVALTHRLFTPTFAVSGISASNHIGDYSERSR